MRGLCWGNGIDQVASRIKLTITFLDPITECTTDFATNLVSGETGTTAIDPLKDRQDFGCVDFRYRPLPEPRKNILLESSFGLRHRPSRHIRLEFIHPAKRNHFEGIGRGKKCRPFVGFLRLTGVDASRKLLPGVLALFPSSSQRHIRIDAQSQALFLTQETVFEPPVFPAGRRDFEVHTAAVSKPVRLLTGSGFANRDVSQRHKASTLQR
ncbi:Uncharacterised protein [Burkholderia pseudomallei]|nr:Uncharacterised protein [Burkholderia pseudomallei]